MRGGVRLPALVVTMGLLAGCSDPAGAVRRERDEARKNSPSPRPSASATSQRKQASKILGHWMGPSATGTFGRLKIRTGRLRSGRIRMIAADLGGHVSVKLTATTHPRAVVVGRYRLTEVHVAKSAATGAYGVAFHAHKR